jgi:hypothetical protein
MSASLAKAPRERAQPCDRILKFKRRRMGLVRDVIAAVLAEQEDGLQMRDIATSATARLGEPIPASTIKSCSDPVSPRLPLCQVVVSVLRLHRTAVEEARVVAFCVFAAFPEWTTNRIAQSSMPPAVKISTERSTEMVVIVVGHAN